MLPMVAANAARFTLKDVCAANPTDKPLPPDKVDAAHDADRAWSRQTHAGHLCHAHSREGNAAASTAAQHIVCAA
jgi:hypothetical protein